MLKGHSNNLEIRLCYDTSMACVGVKRQSQVRLFEYHLELFHPVSLSHYWFQNSLLTDGPTE